MCPRECGVNRNRRRLGYCRTGAGFPIASICLHRGEEPALSGTHGICNVFFAHCNMQCAYCQNGQISDNAAPAARFETDLDSAVRRIGALLDRGARSVGFVSPSHCIPQMRALVQALRAARSAPPIVVMNTNAYDKVETLRALEGLVDVYLPDLKYMDAALSARLSDAPDYPRVAAAALKEMFRQTGAELVTDAGGAARRGLIVRHLVLPGQTANSRRCLAFIAHELSTAVHVSLMAQYTPTPRMAADPVMRRALTEAEYDAVLAELEALGLYNGWTQDLASVEHYMPDFNRPDPFDPSPGR